MLERVWRKWSPPTVGGNVNCYHHWYGCDFCCIYHDFHLCHCCCSVAKLCPTLCDPMDCSSQASLSFTISQSLLKLMSIELVMPSNHLTLCGPLLLLPSIFPRIRVFSSESALRIRWPKYWSFSFNISPSNEHPGLISFRMDWLDLLAVQGTLKSLLQHHSSKASILWHSAFFIVQFSHPYMTTGKTIALTRWTFVGKVMSLLLNMLSRLEKTLESPLDCKEIQPVHPKGDQSWVFIGGTDAEAETPILRPPDAESWLTWKDPDSGKDWGQEEKGTTEDEMIGWHHQLNGHEFE